jgi:hypothetical protein
MADVARRSATHGGLCLTQITIRQSRALVTSGDSNHGDPGSFYIRSHGTMRPRTRSPSAVTQEGPNVYPERFIGQFPTAYRNCRGAVRWHPARRHANVSVLASASTRNRRSPVSSALSGVSRVSGVRYSPKGETIAAHIDHTVKRSTARGKPLCPVMKVQTTIWSSTVSLSAWTGVWLLRQTKADP